MVTLEYPKTAGKVVALSISRRITRITLVCIVAAAVLFAGVMAVANLVLSDDLEFSDGGLTYAFIVRSDTIREFPRIDLTEGPASFHYRARDGTAPGEIQLRYASTKTERQLIDDYGMYCHRKGYDPVDKEHRLLKSDFACDAPDYRIEIDFQGGAARTGITVFFLER
jgi:hypothetical protein